ncbi:hypothetical protein GALMADRAFT_80147 [Galerina marginata CBS 339.88]|uniref:Uncharacterized protein n=1 Tax=Galerina marginata (strain CBS 339.88) TaxID=685588 RepID=A0A067S8K7_GALM3|nr:hypothetical protein GALMADRAFT_80147 [Galerina marginata CBS 339.88]
MRLGMENGFENSPMAAIWQEFITETENGSSTASRAALLAKKPSLSREEIIDLRTSSEESSIRFGVEKSLYTTITTVIDELQSTIQRMVRLIPERATYFVVDPDRVVKQVLAGAESVGQLHAAWIAITRRLEVAPRFMDKYITEYQKFEFVYSPASTVQDIHEEIKQKNSLDDKLRVMHTLMPRHNERFSAQVVSKIGMGDAWDKVLTIPAWMNFQPLVMDAHESPSHSRTSYKSGDKFVLPPEPSDSRNLSKKVGFASSQSALNPYDTTPTAYKTSGNFFAPSDPISDTREQETSTPRPKLSKGKERETEISNPVPPNVFYGLGLPSGPFMPPETPSFLNYKNLHQPLGTAAKQSGATAMRSITLSAPGGNGSSDGNNSSQNGDYSDRGRSRPLPDPPTRRPPAGPRRPNSPPPPQAPSPPRGPSPGGNDSPPRFPSPIPSETPSHQTPREPPAPYGTFIPTIKAEIKMDQLPKWDGNHDSAVEYFWKIQQLAALGGYIPEALGYWLWTGLKEGSSIQMWFATLAPVDQVRMRSHYLEYLKGIKDNYLGRLWQTKMITVYEGQSFRQTGFEHETPIDWLTRRIMYSRMLAKGDNSGQREVYLIMQRAPVSWSSVIAFDSIMSTSQLYAKITEHEKALVQASHLEQSNLLTSDNLVYSLRRLGVRMDKDITNQPSRTSSSGLRPRQKFDTEKTVEETETINFASDDILMTEVYQTLKQRQRPPPKGGYPFPKNDHVSTKMGKLPPSPCKCCGSSNHWDKECPDYNVVEETRKRNGNLVQAADTEDESEQGYTSAYNILLSQRLSSNLTDSESNKNQDFEAAVSERLVEINLNERKSSVNRRRPEISEEDDVDEIKARDKQKSSKHLLEEIGAINDEEGMKGRSPEPNTSSNFSNIPDPPIIDIETSNLPKPPISAPLRLSRRRFPKPGTSAIGISVISMKGYLCSQKNTVIDLRLDSCADISLISEEYFNTLKDVPKVQQGLRMKLWQVTDKDCSLKGFVRIPVFCKTKLNRIIETEVEAYILPGMTVPILLGEDYQQNYEINVSRSVQEGTEIQYENGLHSIAAEPVDRTKDFNRVRESAHLQSVFLKSKIHRRNKNKRHRQKIRQQKESLIVRIAEDVRLKPGETRVVKVQGNFGQDREWLIERNILTNPNDSVIPVPNVLITASDPRVPLANPSTHPRYLRKGEIIGQLIAPEEYFDKPKSAEELDEMSRRALAIANIISSQMPTEVNMGEDKDKGPEVEDEIKEPEQYGPKTAAMPDMTDLPSSKLRELIDVGNLPEHLKERAWAMLEKRINAFGFDGRLGQHPAKVHIRTQEGQVPISVPIRNRTFPQPLERPSSHRVQERETSILHRLPQIKLCYYP